MLKFFPLHANMKRMNTKKPNQSKYVDPIKEKKRPKTKNQKKKKKIFPNRSRLARTGSERTKKNDQSKSADPIKETNRPKTQK